MPVPVPVSVRPIRPLRRGESDLEVAAARVDVAGLDQVRRHAALLGRLGSHAGGHAVPGRIMFFVFRVRLFFFPI